MKYIVNQTKNEINIYNFITNPSQLKIISNIEDKNNIKNIILFNSELSFEKLIESFPNIEQIDYQECKKGFNPFDNIHKLKNKIFFQLKSIKIDGCSIRLDQVEHFFKIAPYLENMGFCLSNEYDTTNKVLIRQFHFGLKKLNLNFYLPDFELLKRFLELPKNLEELNLRLVLSDISADYKFPNIPNLDKVRHLTFFSCRNNIVISEILYKSNNIESLTFNECFGDLLETCYPSLEFNKLVKLTFNYCRIYPCFLKKIFNFSPSLMSLELINILEIDDLFEKKNR